MHGKLNLTFLWLCFLLSASPLAARYVSVPFYGDTLWIEYDPGMKLPGMVIADEISLLDYYEAMEKTPYQIILTSLKKEQERLQLNDWLYFSLLHRTIEEIYPRDIPLKRTLSCWFLLTTSGFDTRLTYLEYDAFLYVWSKDTVFETPMIQDRGKQFVNLSSIIQGERNLGNQLNLLRFRTKKKVKPFEFRLRQLPLLKPQTKTKELTFTWQAKTIRWQIQIDRTVYELMKQYPLIDERYYLEVPLSPTIAASLLPQIRAISKEYSTVQALEFLVALTRSGFYYQEDHDHFGKGKPMIADELFHYPYSDCEDRSALFFRLVKDLLDLPMLIVAYPDHLTIAVASPEISGVPIPFETENYFICDPTGPRGSCQIGHPPSGYESIAYEILGSYASDKGSR